MDWFKRRLTENMASENNSKRIRRILKSQNEKRKRNEDGKKLEKKR